MEIKEIIYGGSKAVKITEIMRRDLDSYNQRKQEVASFEEEIAKQEQEINEKKSEISELNVQASSEDKKEVKEATKKIKSLEKEINKIDDNIKHMRDKMKKLTDKHNKTQLVGVTLNSFPEKEKIENQEVVEDGEMTPVQPEQVEMPVVTVVPPITQFPDQIPVQPAEENVSENEMENEIDEGGTLANPSITEDGETVGFEQENNAANNNVQQSDLPAESDNNFSSELDDDFEIDESTVEPTVDEPAVPVNPTPINPDYSDFDDLNITESEADQIWEGLQNIDLYDTEAPKMYDETTNYEPVSEPLKEVETVSDNVSEPEQVMPEKTEEEIKQEVHNDIEQSIPIVEVPAPVSTEAVIDQVYDEVGVRPEEEPKERDLKNLTLFKDYADYVFTFGQKHYAKDALTPVEIAALDDVKDFLTEKAFETKRATQYNKIDNENKKLKKKVVTLGKEFTKNVDSISAEYSASVEKLTEMAEAAKEQAEADRVEKIQTQKLNDSLTDTINDQSQNIENLTNENSELQSTIEKQKAQIADLEKQNEKQAAKIKDFEEKLNTVFGIVKEVSN